VVTPSYSYNDYQCKFVSYPVLENEQQTKAFLKLLTIGKHILEELHIESRVGQSLPNLTYLTYSDLTYPNLNNCYKAGTTFTPSNSYNNCQCKFVTYPILENKQQTKAFLKLLTIGKHIVEELHIERRVG
jgi:hypothetical protein